MPQLAAAVAPIIERVAQTLADATDLGVLPTHLTGRNRSRGRAPYRRRNRDAKGAKVAPDQRCRECGTLLQAQNRRLCDDCHARLNKQRLSELQAIETDRRKTTDTHPSKRAAVRDQIAATQRSHARARAETPPVSGFTGRPGEFGRLIRPRLQDLSSRQLAEETGLSRGYCAAVRAGQRVPHVRHWAAFQLAGLHATDGRSGP